tara:strand:- start:368 stop:697 length:330 start_codon:yes stop_codon:yes gene_type:complete
MRTLSIPIPDGCEAYESDIWRFVVLMLDKLNRNIHKGHWDNVDVTQAFDLLIDEVEELRAAIKEEDGDSVKLEAADVANFALIIASVLDRRGDGYLGRSQPDLFNRISK